MVYFYLFIWRYR